MKLLTVLCVLIFSGSGASGMGPTPPIERVPIDRLITNLEKYLKLHPDSKSANFEMARLYALAYAKKSGELNIIESIESWLSALVDFKNYQSNLIEVTNGQDPGDTSPPYTKHPYFLDGAHVKVPDVNEDKYDVPFGVIQTSNPEAISRAQKFLNKAIFQYQLGLQKDPTNIYGLLGLGWCEKEAGNYTKAKEHFRKIIKLSENESYQYTAAEAGLYLKMLISEKSDSAEIKKIDALLEEYNPSQGRGKLISPIIIPMSHEAVTYEELTQGSKVVAFDLDGTGIQKKWKWISPKAGWLVYSKGEKITSALQMFGNVSFFSFWVNGYRALKALDDNQDGSISGAELDGLTVWNDANQDGICDAGEMVKLAELKIVSLSTKYEMR